MDRDIQQCEMYKKRVEELEFQHKADTTVIEMLRKSNEEFADRLVKAERLMADYTI